MYVDSEKHIRQRAGKNPPFFGRVTSKPLHLKNVLDSGWLIGILMMAQLKNKTKYLGLRLLGSITITVTYDKTIQNPIELKESVSVFHSSDFQLPKDHQRRSLLLPSKPTHTPHANLHILRPPNTKDAKDCSKETRSPHKKKGGNIPKTHQVSQI